MCERERERERGRESVNAVMMRMGKEWERDREEERERSGAWVLCLLITCRRKGERGAAACEDWQTGAGTVMCA